MLALVHVPSSKAKGYIPYCNMWFCCIIRRLLILAPGAPVNPFWPRDAIWRQRYGSKLAQIIADAVLWKHNQAKQQIYHAGRNIACDGVGIDIRDLDLPREKNTCGRHFDFIIFRRNCLTHLSSPPGQNGHNFVEDVFIWNFMNENFFVIWIKYYLSFFPKGRIKDIIALVQIMAWRWSGWRSW